jgi:hypothetical protein
MLRELVWVGNNEFLAWQRVRREQFITGRNDGTVAG